MTSIRLSKKAATGNLREFTDAIHRRVLTLRSKDGHSMCKISNDMPETGGGAGPDVSASDDDGGGDDDGEPARRSTNKKPIPTFAPAIFTFSLLSHYTSFGRSRIYQLIADPVLRFPSPIKIGKSSRWLKTEVDSWLAKQADSRHQVAG